MYTWEQLCSEAIIFTEHRPKEQKFTGMVDTDESKEPETLTLCGKTARVKSLSGVMLLKSVELHQPCIWLIQVSVEQV